jgi:hypothetical protein
VSAIVAGELVELLLTVTVPLATPLADGAKVTPTTAVCPGMSINPAAPPPELKPAPDTITCEIVTFEFPALVNVTFCKLLLDTFTLPKFKMGTLGFSKSVTGAVTVRFAPLLMMLPAPLLTTAAKTAPLSELVVAGVV